MSDSERQLGIVKDIILPVDVHTRYDVYFTDQRVAIVCMGRANRFESEASGKVSFMPEPFGVPPPIEPEDENTGTKKSIDEETKNWSLNDLLKLSKKSCFYTNDEIEEIKLVAGHKLKFEILSNECESKFNPSQEQFMQLCMILTKIQALRSKLSIAGKWNILEEIFRALNNEQDL